MIIAGHQTGTGQFQRPADIAELQTNFYDLGNEKKHRWGQEGGEVTEKARVMKKNISDA